MSALYLPTRRLTQPFGLAEIDYSDPLAAGLVFDSRGDLNFADGAGARKPSNTVGCPTRQPVQTGVAAGTASTVASFGDVELFTGAQATIQIIEFESNPTQVAGIFNKRLSSTNQNSFSIGYNYTVGSEFSVDIGSSDGSGIAVAYAFSRTTFSPESNNLVITIDGQAGATQKVKLYRNKAPISLTLAGSDVAFSSFPNTTAPLEIGRVNSGSLYYAGRLFLIRGWTRLLSVDEIERTTERPSSVYRVSQHRIWIDMGASGGPVAHQLSASAQANAAATAALSVSKPLAGSGAAQATATAALLKGVSLTAAGLAVSSSSASMSHTVPLQASAAAVAVAGAQLALAVSLSAAGLATALASASLSTSSGAELAANGQAQASSSAVLSLLVSLSAVAVAQALASAALAEGKTLAANALAQAGGTAALQVGNGADLSAAGTAQASAGANLNLTVPLSAAALARAAATGSLLLTVPLTAAAFAQASGSAQFAGDVQMSAQGVSVATATAALQVTAPFARAPEGSRFYQSPPSLRPARTQAGGRPSLSSTSRPPR